MALLIPPRPPVRVGLEDDDRSRRLAFRLWQVRVATWSGLAGTWLATFGPLAAICGLLLVQHLLVCVLLAGIEEKRRSEAGKRPTATDWG